MFLSNILGAASRPTIDSCLRSGQCTFVATSTNFQMQDVFRCITCNITGNQGICATCAQKCHRGHNLVAAGRLNFFCDCNTRGCSAQTINQAPTMGASLQINLPSISISPNPPMPQPYPAQPHVYNPYPQPPQVVYQETHHHHVHVPGPMHVPSQTVSCPVCSGKGGFGAFGACHRGDVHWRRNCSFCNGSGSAMAGSRPCTTCSGKGGMGAFGPCAADDVHFRSACHVCQGKCHVYDTHTPSHYVQPVHHVHHGHSGRGHHHVTVSAHVHSASVQCPVCNGKGGMGTFGACERGSIHWKRNCLFCNGSGSAMAGSRPCTMCSGKGGMGTFGPCEASSIHFKSVCNGCHGKCHVY